MSRSIIHVDMDYFFAQVEIRDNPKLKDLPVAIAFPDSPRSVLCTSNYIARKFGVKSAMPLKKAKALCKNLIIVPPNFSKYEEASRIIQEIFLQFTDLIEPLSLDEAFLDVSHIDNPSELAQKIKNEIFVQTHLTASVGLAPNKFLAKIASDWNKPNGLHIIHENEILDFAQNLPVSLIPGVGPRALETFMALNISKLSDIKNIEHAKLYHYFGNFAVDLKNYSLGIDQREVIANRLRKSLSVETTLDQDLFYSEELITVIDSLFPEIESRLEEYFQEFGPRPMQKYHLKIKFKDFSTQTFDRSFPLTDKINLQQYQEEIKGHIKFCMLKKELPVRLIGLGIRFYENDKHNKTNQLSLFF
jgi:DNA polymerase-4